MDTLRYHLVRAFCCPLIAPPSESQKQPFNGTFSASSRPRIPAQYAEACLLKQTAGPVVVETVLRLRVNVSSVVGIMENRWHFLKSPGEAPIS